MYGYVRFCSVFICQRDFTMKETRVKVPTFVIHLLVWFLFIVLLSVIDPFVTSSIRVWIGGWSMLILGYASLLYGTANLILPRYWNNSPKLTIVVMLCCFAPFTGYFYIVYKYGMELLGHQSSISSLTSTTKVAAFWFTIIQTIACFMFYYRNTIDQLKKQQIKQLQLRDKEVKLKDRENKVIQKELNFLKSQFNAHITFNILTSIYSKIYDVDEESACIIELFSDILHYSIDNNVHEEIPLEEEVSYIKNFIGLQKLLREDVYVDFSCRGDMSNVKIFPRIIIGLVENAFKHGVSNQPNQPIKINLIINGYLEFRVQNSKSKNKYVISNGIGNDNIIQSLEYYYTERYTFDVNESKDDYMCNLVIR